MDFNRASVSPPDEKHRLQDNPEYMFEILQQLYRHRSNLDNLLGVLGTLQSYFEEDKKGRSEFNGIRWEENRERMGQRGRMSYT